MKVVIKKLFSIDVILLFIAIFTLTATELFKALTFKEFTSLEYTIQASVSGDDREVLSKLEKQLEPYLYFNKELSVFIASSGKITNPIDFLGEIHLIQRRIAIGFDNLFLFCALLFSISIAILTSLFLKEKVEQEQRQSLNESTIPIQTRFTRQRGSRFGCCKDIPAKRQQRKSFVFP